MRALTLADDNKCPKIAGAKAPIAPVGLTELYVQKKINLLF